MKKLEESLFLFSNGKINLNMQIGQKFKLSKNNDFCGKNSKFKTRWKFHKINGRNSDTLKNC